MALHYVTAKLESSPRVADEFARYLRAQGAEVSVFYKCMRVHYLHTYTTSSRAICMHRALRYLSLIIVCVYNICIHI